jgi:hypothetical protein
MKSIPFLLAVLFLTSCASDKPKFVKENVCSEQALKYLKNPRNRYKKQANSPKLIQDMANTTNSMQLCYEDFKNRTGYEEFNTCLVVGVDHRGRTEFFNFGSKEIKLDKTFEKCAQTVTKSVRYSSYGRNYILIQSYQFYVGN